ncbi:ATPase [Paraglaciecola agarilytica]|uniref:FimV/HubP family polar landmark protein n=1 Tax=Paraglaciecola chathamensis TaxID=368405 RepID=UPI001C08E9BC|nr:FimV/HubP family polar landmark protein [Paraglaciecola agarilytica]MBU3018585.1 ATPase [Paraglaciecola agarilytica]
MNLRTLALLFVASLTLTFAIGLEAADFQQIRIKGPKNSDSDFSGQTYGPITSSDTLWRIASEARQNTSHSIYQVMLATYELNPDAFERDNINLMRDGAILRLPASGYVSRVNEAQAIAKVRYDNQLLNLGGEDAGSSAGVNANKTLASKDDLDETKDIIEKRLGAIDEEQNRQFQQIRQQFAESILSVQSILNENQRVFESLDSVNKDLAEIRSQEALRDEQIVQMGKSIDELLAKSRDAEAKALAEQQKGGFTDWLMKPLTLIITSILVSLFILGGFAYWLIKRKKPQEMDLDLLATKDEPADTYVASEMDDLSDALSEELSSELDDENLFGDQSVGDDVLAEELKESFDEKDGLHDKEEFDDLGDDMLVPDSELNPTEDFEAGNDELDQDDLDNLFEDEDDLLAEIDDEMDNISLSDDEEQDNSDDSQVDEIELDVAESTDKEESVPDEQDASLGLDVDDLDALDELGADSEVMIDEGPEEALEDELASEIDDAESEVDTPADSAQDVQSDINDISPVEDADEQPEINIDDLLVEPKPELPESSEVNADDPINEDMLEQLDKEIASQSEELDNITSNLIDELEQVEMMQDMLPEGEEEAEPEFTGTPQRDIQQLDKITEDLGDIFADADAESSNSEPDESNLGALAPLSEQPDAPLENQQPLSEQVNEPEEDENDSALELDDALETEDVPEADVAPSAAQAPAADKTPAADEALLSEQADDETQENHESLSEQADESEEDENDSALELDDALETEDVPEAEVAPAADKEPAADKAPLSEQADESEEDENDSALELDDALETEVVPEADVAPAADKEPAAEEEPAADEALLSEQADDETQENHESLSEQADESEEDENDSALELDDALETEDVPEADVAPAADKEPAAEEEPAADEEPSAEQEPSAEEDAASAESDTATPTEDETDLTSQPAEVDPTGIHSDEQETTTEQDSLDELEFVPEASEPGENGEASEEDALEQALADFDTDEFESNTPSAKPVEEPLTDTELGDIDALADFDDDELESALQNFVLDDEQSNDDEASTDHRLPPSQAQENDELDEFPELEDWLNEVDEDETDSIEELESASFDDMLQSLDDDLSDSLESASVEKQAPSNINQAGQNIDSAVDIATLLEEEAPDDAERDFVDVDDLLNDSITADPLPEKALDLESIMGEFSTAKEDSDHVDVDSDDGFGAKLDLAHAYIEIGEMESATELLEDIIEYGHPPQSDEAKRVLASLQGEE